MSFISANPVGIGVIYILAPNYVADEPEERIPTLVNDWLICVHSLPAHSSCGCVPFWRPLDL